MMLNNEQLRKVAPSIFAMEPWQEVSEHYRFVPTVAVVDRMREAGFFPVKAMQSRTRIEGKEDFTKHVIRFRTQRDCIDAGQEVPELILVNSHDRTSSYQLHAGIFRLVCLNGMIVASSQFDSIRIQHSGRQNLPEQVIEASFQMIDVMPQVMSQVERFKEIELSRQQQEAYAAAALELRNSTIELTPDRLLTVRRSEDRSKNLWNTFNAVQENIIKGGIRGQTRTGSRKTRQINSVSEDLRINKALWRLTEEMAKIAV